MDKGVPRMTPDMLKECCVKNQGWSSPELNECLVLHYKGFRKIENLQPYANVNTLWLECNGISRIEGLATLSGLVTLNLQSNVIDCIENLEGLTSLQYLDLSHNSLSQVDGLASLENLKTIKLSRNKITEVDGLRGLLERPSLESVDVSQNYRGRRWILGLLGEGSARCSMFVSQQEPMLPSLERLPETTGIEP
jgi:dynein assembly factor 1